TSILPSDERPALRRRASLEEEAYYWVFEEGGRNSAADVRDNRRSIPRPSFSTVSLIRARFGIEFL
ncbi:MAG TPA: hypothetical protein VHC70_06635, partial [Phycisphaerales bacterium]|nr:hypothetical protein [Phycisphaerales bacterium]